MGREPGLTLHHVEFDVRERLRFMQIAIELGYEYEVYDDVAQCLSALPRSGIIVFRDDQFYGGASTVVGLFQAQGINLPLIATGYGIKTKFIIDAIRSGELDYLFHPIEASDLEFIAEKFFGESGRSQYDLPFIEKFNDKRPEILLCSISKHIDLFASKNWTNQSPDQLFISQEYFHYRSQ